ncbi:MAG: pantoate--beta-alanine ligase [Planctomyces sp.]|nr:pantoate--beta-alanine ligase [Planctomyces sp.]MBA4039780.1 pantoate--beta-alanine ligase [Planctomyces sp.]MBA4119216.1 pantoate--beta-alanine ligase [Isosphaera sp.]
MRVVTSERELRGLGGCVCVPTMGALHAGHASLVRAARAAAGAAAPVVVTVFVNPTQFNDAADLARYPRTLEADAALCHQSGADAVFAPPVGEVYPHGRVVRVPALPAVATEPGLEDRWRPGHFAGVCQVVARLFEMVSPAAAVFGQKDWQQLQVIRAMTAQERLGVEIIPGETVREHDGLAMSSRNRFLSAADRAPATALSRALAVAAQERDACGAEKLMLDTLRSAGHRVEYAVVRQAETLGPITRAGDRGRALIATRLGDVRLIDNAAW